MVSTEIIPIPSEQTLNDEKSSSKERILAIALALISGILWDYFFYNQHFGISVALYAAFLIVSAAIITQKRSFSKTDGFLLVANLLLCLTFALFNNPVLRALNSLAIPFSLTAYMLSYRYDFWRNPDIFSPFRIFGKLIPHSLSTAPKLIQFSVGALKPTRGKGLSDSHRQALMGALMALPLLIIVVSLLAGADSVFSRIINDTLNHLNFNSIQDAIPHGITILLVTLYFFGYMWSFRYDYPFYKSHVSVRPSWSPISLITFMALLCVAYAFFTTIQFAYLYCGFAHLPSGLTYAEYARKGFFELLFVTFINVAVILICTSKARYESPHLERIVRITSSLMTLFTLNLLVSAFYRMHLYELAYGYTELRLFVQFFMGFMTVSLIALAIWIWKRNFPIIRTAMIAAVSFYLLLNYVNVDRVIAHNNLNRTQTLATSTLDTDLLSGLSVDAYPDILYSKLNPMTKKFLLVNYAKDTYVNTVTDHDQWFEYNYGYSRYVNERAYKPVPTPQH